MNKNKFIIISIFFSLVTFLSVNSKIIYAKENNKYNYNSSSEIIIDANSLRV